MTKAELDSIKILPLDDSWYRRVKEKLDGIAKPLDGLGKFEHLIAQIGAIEKTTGIQLVQQCHRDGYEMLATGEMGIGNTTTSTAVAAALLDLEVEQVTGKGAGLTDEALKRKCRVIEEAIEKYSLRDADAFTILKTVGGLDIAGLTGVFIGAAIEQIPVVIDGVISAVAALLAETLCKGAVNYMIPSHKSRELAETAIMKKLRLDPLLDADMALGEGTGAVMMMSLLDVALGVYLQGASFANFEIEQYKRYEE